MCVPVIERKELSNEEEIKKRYHVGICFYSGPVVYIYNFYIISCGFSGNYQFSGI